MADVFVSYARPDEPQAKRVADALRNLGFSVWRDDELPAHRAYSDVILERLNESRAVVVLWSADATKSQWVRAEADAARQAGTLVQITLDGSVPPLPFNQIHCADLTEWRGSTDAKSWRKVASSISVLVGSQAKEAPPVKSAPTKLSVCVLPFLNMSGDAEQEYFSDGISEDITIDLSKVSALDVVARNTAFTFKGRSVDVSDVARSLGVTHVLEGSVRKAGGRVRISAQLIDGQTGRHVWADRFDRELTDIFAIQDEISRSIVDALKLRLLPEESEAIASRGTESADAYNLYLKARQQWISGTHGTIRQDREIVRICKQALAVDPDYAQAWALMALAQAELRFWHGEPDDPLLAANRALTLDPAIPEALCVRARHLEQEGKTKEANEVIKKALELNPDSWEANPEAARLLFRQKRLREAIPLFERSMSLMSNDFHSGDILMDCYKYVGDLDSLRQVAEKTLPRCEAALDEDPANGTALAAGTAALLALGDKDGAKEWVRRALLLDADNPTMLYNLACPLTRHGTEPDLALELFERSFETLRSVDLLKHIEADPDVDSVRADPRFQKMLAAARERLGLPPVNPLPASGERPRS